jgi:hypothetical protein
MTNRSLYAVPLRPDFSARASRPAGAVVRLAAARLLAHIQKCEVDDVIEQRWRSDDALPMLARAAVVPAAIGESNWATSLAASAVGDFLTTLGPQSAGSTLLSRGIQLQFGATSSIAVPGIVSAANVAGFVQQGQPIPVQTLDASAALLSPRSLKSICLFSRELFEHSTPAIEGVVGQVMRENVGLTLDTIMLDATAGNDIRPAGLLYNIAAGSESSNVDLKEAMLEDIETLLAAVGAVSVNNPIVLVASPARAIRMRLRLASVSDPGFEVLGSNAVASDELIAVASNGLISASETVPRIDISRLAAVMQNTVPLPIVDGSSVPGPNTRSLFQTDSIGMKIAFEVSWLAAPTRQSRGSKI